MAVSPPVCDFGWKAPEFALPATDGRTLTFADVAGPKGTLVMFICNHCPYVLAVMDRIQRDAEDLQKLGIGVVAICSNDAESYPADSFENMQEMAADRGFPFAYLHDKTQEVARAYDAACTPDFFGFDAQGGLQYRGRLDASGRQAADPSVRRDLFEAMKHVAETGQGPRDQIPSMGCSIKWKAA
ncbi:thioredoxin family protein [Tropicibacter naphthalenivorans]|uniref:Thiol-disulfide oxidoreductase n=1 Tax=Tropicibacter naphthalenivorans TaxID=441103 RepID=A0A0P1GK93_9RHOB|nr:thioredoxin family protein [Tropicibacter naphthalenivorans]CUH82436.1 thiol-disulfide oxidoreductase [Tropicibacter naphthalenivorans]SMD06161.1 AhpC/TSA family protein [Tropicibacter naphthalenivorans]